MNQSGITRWQYKRREMVSNFNEISTVYFLSKPILELIGGESFYFLFLWLNNRRGIFIWGENGISSPLPNLITNNSKRRKPAYTK